MTQRSKQDFASDSNAAKKTETNSSNLFVGFSNRIYLSQVSRRSLFGMILFFVILAVGIGVRYVPDLNWIAEREDSLRSKIAAAPIICYLLGLVLYIGLSLIPGTAGKSIVFGWFFGFLAALFLVEIGLTAAAILSFLAGRFLVRHMLNRRWQIYLRSISKKFAQEGAFYLIWLRMAHAPFTLVNYGAGATEIPLTTFWWTTHVGILPATIVCTFAGSRIPNISTVAEKGIWAIVDPWLFIILGSIAFFPILLRPWLRRNRH